MTITNRLLRHLGIAGNAPWMAFINRYILRRFDLALVYDRDCECDTCGGCEGLEFTTSPFGLCGYCEYNH